MIKTLSLIVTVIIVVTACNPQVNHADLPEDVSVIRNMVNDYAKAVNGADTTLAAQYGKPVTMFLLFIRSAMSRGGVTSAITFM